MSNSSLEKCLNDIYNKECLEEAYNFSKKFSICRKVQVGGLYELPDQTRYLTSNSGGGHGQNINCVKDGKCHKQEVTGIYESCEETRPFCASVHCEVKMVNMLKDTSYKGKPVDTSIGIMYVTRYPCIDCITHLAEAGFKHVVYGGRQEISDDVKKVISDNNMDIIWYPEVDHELHTMTTEEHNLIIEDANCSHK